MRHHAIHAQLATLRTVEAPTKPVESALPAPIVRSRRAAAAPRGGLVGTDLAGKLEQLSGSALDRASDLLDMDISDEADEKFGEKVRGLNSVVKTVLQTQVRVDQHRLKARSLDVLPELLELINQEEAKRKAVTV